MCSTQVNSLNFSFGTLTYVLFDLPSLRIVQMQDFSFVLIQYLYFVMEKSSVFNNFSILKYILGFQGMEDGVIPPIWCGYLASDIFLKNQVSVLTAVSLQWKTHNLLLCKWHLRIFRFRTKQSCRDTLKLQDFFTPTRAPC